MGILKNIEGDGHDIENVNSITLIDPLIHVDDTTSSSSEDEDIQENVVISALPTITPVPLTSTRTPKVKKTVSKIPKPILHVKNIGGKQSQGHRQARRHENMCFLLNLATDLDEDFAEVNINDLVDTTISAFAQLLLSKNKMKIWQEFVELPERQQERIVKVATDKKQNKKKKERLNNNLNITSTSCSSDENLETFVLIENRTTTNDHDSMNILHRQEEADTCFRRIDPNIRYTLKSMIKRNHLPFERINWFEDDVIPFFKENPDSVYLRDLTNGFDRMLLHAVCQYLNLISKSFTRDGERYTQVENRRMEFIPPIMLLSEYVKTMNGTMNAPATFESFLLLDGEKKIIVEKDTKVPNAVVFTIAKEDHTLANMLRAQLLKDPQVIFAGYKIPHPLENKVILRVQTSGHEYSPINAMENAIKDLIFEINILEDRVRSAITNRQSAE
ncbi:unnamed protein product [Adineta steineri]|uniref:R3H domain-containing protein n=1 Tax=Adineta steineri TaxID=433720 RepID=A0A818WL05_9BILA|nr:unnamed protein product [Adineta steineri]CAF1198379.1 unnamed protein product [Adineta steineri]CAF3727512.1 unnamed protein product [Adineta steineri]